MIRPKIKVRKNRKPETGVCTARDGPHLRTIPLQDDPFFDNAEIDTIKRFKTSGLSGDEWRFSYKVVLSRKGVTVATRDCGSMRAASLVLAQAIDLGYGGIEDDPEWDLTPWSDVPREEYCCQPGCSALATHTFVLKRLYYDGATVSVPNLPSEIGTMACRVFCSDHRVRGDSDLEDRDANYLLVRQVKRRRGGHDQVLGVEVIKQVPLATILEQIRSEA